MNSSIKLFCLGPEGSFSHSAALTCAELIGGAIQLDMSSTVEGAVRRVASSGPASPVCLAVVPYYNFLEGLVQEHLDLIYEFSLYIGGLIRVPIKLAAGGFNDVSGSDCEVLSHPKALAQVSEFVHSHMPRALLRPVESTAEAARLVSASRSGVAIASEEALARFGVPILATDVGNLRHGKANFTDFFVVTKANEIELPSLGVPTHSLIAITPQINRIGLLSEILRQFFYYDLDIAKIHSRPALDPVDNTEEPQMFYLEVKSTPDSEQLTRCAAAIRYKYGAALAGNDMMRILGAFRV